MSKQTTGPLHEARETLRLLKGVEITGVERWDTGSIYFARFTGLTDQIGGINWCFSAKDELDAFMRAKAELERRIKRQQQAVAILQAASWKRGRRRQGRE